VTTPAGTTQSLVANIDLANGDLNWARIVPDFIAGSASVANDDNRWVVLGGSQASQPLAMMTKLRVDGAFAGQMVYGQIDRNTSGNDVIVTSCDRGYAATGQTDMLPNAGLLDLHLVKTNDALESSCRERPVTPDLRDPELTVPAINLQVVAGQGWNGWERVVSRPDSSNNRYCFTLGCPADVDDGTGTGTPDGGVGIEDLLFYLQLFGAGASCADLDDGSGSGTLDGGVGIEDLLFYLDRYEAGC
jgi:hypothetical protein